MSKRLLFSVTKKDFVIKYFSGTGAGGQHRNKHQNCVRLFHPDSGGRTTGQSHREAPANLREAFRNMLKHPKFVLWMDTRTYETMNKITIDEIVEREMAQENLKIEVKGKDGWEQK